MFDHRTLVGKAGHAFCHLQSEQEVPKDRSEAARQLVGQ